MHEEVLILLLKLPIGGKTLLMESYMKKLLERSGKTQKGSITGIYTVLVDGDDLNGPVPDLAWYFRWTYCIKA